MTLTVQPETPPLRQEADGAIRVGKSRVLLELVIGSFQEGATPEEIVRWYDTLALSDVYAVIAYYLKHRGEIEAYLAEREQGAREIEAMVESRQGDLSEIRARIAARRRG